MADINGLLSDPDFAKLSPGDQRQALSRLDPDFSKLSDQDYQSFRQRVQPPSFTYGSGNESPEHYAARPSWQKMLMGGPQQQFEMPSWVGPAATVAGLAEGAPAIYGAGKAVLGGVGNLFSSEAGGAAESSLPKIPGLLRFLARRAPGGKVLTDAYDLVRGGGAAVPKGTPPPPMRWPQPGTYGGPPAPEAPVVRNPVPPLRGSSLPPEPPPPTQYPAPPVQGSSLQRMTPPPVGRNPIPPIRWNPKMPDVEVTPTGGTPTPTATAAPAPGGPIHPMPPAGPGPTVGTPGIEMTPIEGMDPGVHRVGSATADVGVASTAKYQAIARGMKAEGVTQEHLSLIEQGLASADPKIRESTQSMLNDWATSYHPESIKQATPFNAAMLGYIKEIFGRM